MTENEQRPGLNRVLFEPLLPFRKFEDADGKQTWLVDGSGLPFLVEELIALSAVQVVVPDNAVAASFVDSLVPPLKNRVKVVSSRRVLDARNGLCEPIGEEFGIKPWRGALVGPGPDAGSEINEIFRAFRIFWSALPDFLLGMEYEVMVDINLNTVAQATKVLRESSKNERTRAVMAAFQGVFATYRATELDGLVLTSSTPGDLPILLERLVEDETFRNLSASVHTVAFPEKRDRALQLVLRFAKDLASRKVFKHLFGVGKRAVETVTHVPLPDREAIGDIIGTGYLPPLVCIDEVVTNAYRLWREQAPPFVPLDDWDVTGKRR